MTLSGAQRTAIMSRYHSALAHLTALTVGPAATQLDSIDIAPGAAINLRDGEALWVSVTRREHERPYSMLLEELRVADAGEPQPARIGGSDSL